MGDDVKNRGQRRRWDGGYKHRQRDGKDLFIIEKQVGKKRFHISTRCHSETAAYEHLKRFQADPWAYEAEMKVGREPDATLRLTDELVSEFGEWLLARDRPTTPKYAAEIEARLLDWVEELGGNDLRRLELGKLKAALAKKRGRQHRIIALKSFCSWLRTEKHLLDRRDDVTLDLLVPQAVPEKHKRRKAVPFEHVKSAMTYLAPAYRDCLLLLSHTGWHVSELERFIRDTESGIADGRGEVLGVLQVLHKTGATTRTPILVAGALEAAKRLKERKEVPRKMNSTLRAACRLAGVAEFTFGVMRHSVATWAVEAGTPVEVVAEFLNHKSKKTTETFYVDLAVPTRTVRLPEFT